MQIIKKIEKCIWIVRDGSNNSFWAYTPCNPGFNYLSKIKSKDEIKSAYDGRVCPICGKMIKTDLKLIEDEEV